VTSNILVKNGHTIVIGGLFREETQHVRNQVPGIGNVPILGALFRRTDDTVNRRELIILLTPRIVRQEPDEAVSEQLKDDVERFRVGQRKGLQWFGRERLTEVNMRLAKRYLAKGNTAAALWQLDLALAMRPRLEEALRLKERLTQQTTWAKAPRHSSIKYAINSMIMHELGKPTERVIPPRKPRSAKKISPEVRKAFGIEERYEDPVRPGVVGSEKKVRGQLKPPAKVTDEQGGGDLESSQTGPG